jgi:hypothetical protein
VPSEFNFAFARSAPLRWRPSRSFSDWTTYLVINSHWLPKLNWPSVPAQRAAERTALFHIRRFLQRCFNRPEEGIVPRRSN